jgi:hypothetical protein
MRAFWLAVLATGLILVSLDVYEASRATPTVIPTPSLCDDGSGMPKPTPKTQAP